MQALVAKNTRLQAQLEIAESRSASKIKQLELEVNALELDKRMSAAMPITQAPQPAVPISPSHSVLQGQIARLQQEVVGRDVIIAELEDEVMDLLGKFSKCHEASAAMTQFVGAIVTGTVAAEEHKPSRKPTPEIAVTGPDSAAKPISTSPVIGSNDDSRTGSHTPASGLSSPKAAADAAYTPTVSSKPDYAQVRQMQRKNAPPRRPNYYKARFHSPVTHAQLSAEKAAKQQGHFGQRTQQQSQKPNRGGNPANQRGRGDEDGGRGKGSTLDDSPPGMQYPLTLTQSGPKTTQATVSANPESRAGPEARRATEGMDQLSLRSDVFFPMPTTAPSSVMTSVPRLAPTQESSNAPSAIDRKVADSLAPVSWRQVSNQAFWDESDPEEPAKTEVPDLGPKRV